MKKYKVTINSEKDVQKLNDKIAIDSLFSSPKETLTNNPLLVGTNYIDDERIYNSALEYSKTHKGVYVNKLDTFEFMETQYEVCKDKNGHTKINEFEPIKHTFVINDTFVQIDGYRLKIKYVCGYSYMLRKTFLGTDDVTRLAGMFVSSLWYDDTLKVINHVRILVGMLTQSRMQTRA